MKKLIGISFVIIILVIIAFLFFSKKPTKPPTQTVAITGCYIAHIDKNVYTLNIQSQNGSSITGTMHYDNFQFDDSSGTFSGTFENNILLGDYSFTAEGTNSIRQLIWKRSGNDFIQGSGDYTIIDGHEVFADLAKVTWDQNRIFTKSPCI